MKAPLALVGCHDAGAAGSLRSALRIEGMRVGSTAEDDGLDVAIYLDDVPPPGPIPEVPARKWITEAVDRLTEALSFFGRCTRPLAERSGVAVAITSIAGTVGLADHSLASSVSAGVRGALVSMLQDAPALTAVCLIPASLRSMDARFGSWRPDGPEPLSLHDDDVLRWSAAEVRRIVRDDALRHPGQLITVMHEPIAQ